MRTLTIGVLIVTTGTLAALPFRNPPTDGPGEPPTRSPESGPYGALVADSWPDRPTDSRPFESPPMASPLSRSANQPRNRPSPVTVSDRGNEAGGRSTPSDSGENAAATYEDWMIPVDESKLIRERFSATIAADRSQRRAEPNRAEPSHLSDRPEEPEPSLERPTETNTHPTTALPASLKSVPPSMSDDDRTARERHWIRQPR